MSAFFKKALKLVPFPFFRTIVCCVDIFYLIWVKHQEQCDTTEAFYKYAMWLAIFITVNF